MKDGRIIVIGASAGGVQALQDLASQLPAGFPAPILVVLHIGSHPSVLPELLARSGPLPAAHAVDGDEITPGRILVAPPDHHLLVDGDCVRVWRGAKENHARPAIDALFRSAAVCRGRAVIGVLLTGFLDDGTAGLQEIKHSGGVVVVQDPKDAHAPSMPLSALRYVEVDYKVPLAVMGATLTAILEAATPTAAVPPARVVHESEILLGNGDFMEHLRAIATPSTFVCPECEGSLWEINGSDPKRFRCHTGHGFTLRTLQHAQGEAADDAMWSALRALQEKHLLLKALADNYRVARDLGEAKRLQEEAEEVGRHAETLRSLIEGVPAPPE